MTTSRIVSLDYLRAAAKQPKLYTHTDEHGTWSFRCMTGSERNDYVDTYKHLSATPGKPAPDISTKDALRMQYHLLFLTLVVPGDNGCPRLFSTLDEACEVLTSLPHVLVDALAKTVGAVNGIGAAAQKELEGNS